MHMYVWHWFLLILETERVTNDISIKWWFDYKEAMCYGTGSKKVSKKYIVFRNGNIQAKFQWPHVRDAEEEIPSLSGKLNWVTRKTSSNTKDSITHEDETLDGGHLGTMYHVPTRLPCHQLYEKTVLKDVFNILFWITIPGSKQIYSRFLLSSYLNIKKKNLRPPWASVNYSENLSSNFLILSTEE